MRCRLTDDIEKIRSLRELGYSYSYIAKVMNVSYWTARNWCLSEDRRKKEYKHKYMITPKKEVDMQKMVERNKRKRNLMPEEVRKWRRQYMRKYRRTHSRNV